MICNPHQKNAKLRRRFAAMGVVLFLVCSSGGAFLITVHGHLTEDALEAFPATQISTFERHQITLGSRNTDWTEGGLPLTETHYEKRFHFDNATSYTEVLRNYADLVTLLDYTLGRKRRDPYEFGKILHAAEDFDAHSNYVNLYRDYKAAHGNPMVGQIPPFEAVYVAPDDYPGFVPLLDAKLRTGKYPQDMGFRQSAQDYHGGFVGTGMNKDFFLRAHFDDARETAVMTAKWYLQLYVGDPNAKVEYALFKTTLEKELERTGQSTSLKPVIKEAILSPKSFDSSTPNRSPINAIATAPIAAESPAVKAAPPSHASRGSLSKSRHRRKPVHRRRSSGGVRKTVAA